MSIFLNHIKKIVVLSSLLLCTHLSYGQLVVNHEDINFLVQDVLLCDKIPAANVKFTGDQQGNMIGHFNGTKCNIGLKDGVILSTGYVADAIGPNDEPNKSGNMQVNGDGDLNMLSKPTFDASVLEFDFTPLSDSVAIKYVFASEEYLEYVGSAFNDVFGFFLSGPGINGPYSNHAINIAVTPGTSTPVSINTINTTSNSNLYIDNGSGHSGTPQYTNNSVTQFDGFTRVLVARWPVTPGLTYHIKLAIADVSDGIYDSAVFLEGGSFFSQNFTTHQFKTYPNLYEGCDSAVVDIKMTPSQFNVGKIPVIVYGTATNGIDYTKIPDSLTVNPKDGTTSFKVVPLKDNIADDNESVYVVLHESVCNDDTFHFVIKDLYPITVTDYDTVYCGGPINIKALYKGGAVPTLTWLANQSSKNPINVNPGWNTTVYPFTVNDHCNQGPKQGNVTAIVNNKKPNAGPDLRYCSGPSVIIGDTAHVGYAYQWTPATGLNNATISNPTVTLTDTGKTKKVVDYVVETNNGMCTAKDTVAVTVLPNPVAIIDPKQYVECPVFYVTPEDHSVVADSVQYIWSSSDGQQDTGKNAVLAFSQAGSYNMYLTVTNYGMCTAKDSVVNHVKVLVPPVAEFTMSDSIVDMMTPTVTFQSNPVMSVGCSMAIFGPKDELLDTSAVCDFSYDIPTAGYNTAVQYVVAGNGCRDTLKKSIYVKPEYFVYAPNAFTNNGDNLNDNYEVYYSWAIEDFDFYIFDRWGHIIFHQLGNKNKISWDGRAPDGTPQPIGVYVYMYTYSKPTRGIMGDKVQEYGRITLVR